ncbi:MAG TPA: hypothetical protein VKA08_04590 [Balneolales bacterium]|nr:hypothetical protein [Balneolales bacterium]
MNILTLLILSLVLSCQHTPVTPKPPVPEPYFKSGEYGGDAMPGTEWITAAFPSPDGQKIILVRNWTPGRIGTDPMSQLWIVNKDGSDPKLIATGSGAVSWSSDDSKIALTYAIDLDTYLFTIDLQTMEAKQLTGRKDQYFDKSTVSQPIWFQDGNRLLVSVWGKAYQQSFERGLYIMNLKTDSIRGPLVSITDRGGLAIMENI